MEEQNITKTEVACPDCKRKNVAVLQIMPRNNIEMPLYKVGKYYKPKDNEIMVREKNGEYFSYCKYCGHYIDVSKEKLARE